jgi:hypothetical protein
MKKTSVQIAFAVALTAVAAFGADNTLGTWKLNVGKSKVAPAPSKIKSLSVVREASDGGVKVTTTGERADGTKIDSTYTAKYDGTPATVTGTGLLYNTISIKQVNANTLTDERKSTGTPYKATGRMAVSGGGKIMTLTTKGTSVDGKDFTSTLVFDKQ